MERRHIEVTAESDRGGQHLIAAMAAHGAEAVIPTAAARLHGHGQEHHRIDDVLRAEQVIGFLPHCGVHVAYALTGVGPALLLDVGASAPPGGLLAIRAVPAARAAPEPAVHRRALGPARLRNVRPPAGRRDRAWAGGGHADRAPPGPAGRHERGDRRRRRRGSPHDAVRRASPRTGVPPGTVRNGGGRPGGGSQPDRCRPGAAGGRLGSGDPRHPGRGARGRVRAGRRSVAGLRAGGERRRSHPGGPDRAAGREPPRT